MENNLKLAAPRFRAMARLLGDRASVRAGQIGITWEWFLLPSVLVSLSLFALPQGMFIWLSFHTDLGLGQVSEALSAQSTTMSKSLATRSIVMPSS